MNEPERLFLAGCQTKQASQPDSQRITNRLIIAWKRFNDAGLIFFPPERQGASCPEVSNDGDGLACSRSGGDSLPNTNETNPRRKTKTTKKMYYEEKIINGILCWRSTPKGMWTAYSAEELTIKLTELRGSWE